MGARDKFRLAPTREGITVASPWRFWGQGAELYLGPREAIDLVKVSIHRSGVWQLRVGNDVRPLPVRGMISGGWVHALAMYWIVLPGAGSPENELDAKVHRAEFAAGEVLIVNLLIAPESGPFAPPSRSPRASFPWATRLRDGRCVLLHQVPQPLTPGDLEIAQEVLQQAPQLAGDEYGEVSRLQPHPRTNTIVTVPMIRDVGDLRSSVEARCPRA